MYKVRMLKLLWRGTRGAVYATLAMAAGGFAAKHGLPADGVAALVGGLTAALDKLFGFGAIVSPVVRPAA